MFISSPLDLCEKYPERFPILFYSGKTIDQSKQHHYLPDSPKLLLQWRGNATYDAHDVIIETPFLQALDEHCLKKEKSGENGGIVLYLSFEAGLCLHNLLTPQENQLYAVAYAYDSLITFPSSPHAASLGTASLPNNLTTRTPISLTPTLSKQGYQKIYKKAQEYIAAGKLYQVNLCTEFNYQATSPINPWLFFLKTLQMNPAPFSAYCTTDELTLISCSPEQFLTWENGFIQTAPIAGTYSPQNYQDIATFLETKKETSEHLMIVDLERNDIASIADSGPVSVARYRQLESTSSVSHLVSKIKAPLKHFSFTKVMSAMFPGGSISGCPKRAALSFIQENEPFIRGPYTGTIGLYDYNNFAKFNILIRSAQLSDCNISFKVGSGIIHESTLDEEWQEIAQKADGLLATIDTHFSIT